MSHLLTVDEVQRAGDTWGANCGPGALAGVLGLPIDQVRTHLVGFEQKRYTNPTMMKAALISLGVQFAWCPMRAWRRPKTFPFYGLVRVQWDGPWLKPGVHPSIAYRHTHWVAASDEHRLVFDVNCVCVNGGWIPVTEWIGSVVPWLLKQCEPNATGDWFVTHHVEIQRPEART